MSVEVVVTGIGLTSALGSSLQASWSRLLAGESGIKICQPFMAINPCPLGLIGSQPCQLPVVTAQVVQAALEDAQLTPPLQDIGVVIGSSRKLQAQWEQLIHAQLLAEETHLSISPEPDLAQVPYLYGWSPAGFAAAQVKTRGPVLSPMAACATGIWAIAQGVELIQTHQCNRVLAGAVETPITPLTLAGFAKMGALAATGAYPFDWRREGFVLGEGGAVLVLETAESASQRGAKVYGKILGFGLTADGYHVSAPDHERRWAIAAVQQCLQRSRLTVDQIDYIHAHGTATQLNDQAEAKLMQALFVQPVAISSTKGATGHPLGAAAALGVAFSCMALQQQILPPCVGLADPAFDLNFIHVARTALMRTALCFSFGFGGQNAVLALGAP